jgi:ABC-type multidrug transport system fused ATPase/permease subunit
VGIVGKSGAGKTTFVDTILGLAKVAKGTLTIGGLKLGEFPIREWRRRVGYVSQENAMFNMPIRDYIAWDGSHYSDAEIVEAARLANADEFIRAMPKGYDSEVGDNGMRLSGGQRQRLGLARSLIGKKEILILDEATSGLDSISEQPILKSIENLRGKMTVLIVAHRIATVRNSDLILVFDQGRIAEVGTWAELTEGDGILAQMWKIQSSEPQSQPAASEVPPP